MRLPLFETVIEQVAPLTEQVTFSHGRTLASSGSGSDARSVRQ
jgi:hypothetical protein